MNLLQLFRKKETSIEEQTIIIDTSALESKDVMKIINKAKKVILLSEIIDEMDKFKKQNNLFGFNIRELARKSREDEAGRKYICVNGYGKHNYNDKNIIYYCRLHRNTVIVTSDNCLCNHAKAYGIKYIFLECIKKKSLKVKKKKKSKIIRQQVKSVVYKNQKLYFITKQKSENLFLFRDGNLIQDISEKMVEIKLEDVIYEIKKGKDCITLLEYEIQVISKNNYAFCKEKEEIKVSEINKVDEKKLPKEIVESIYKFLKRDETKNEDSLIENKNEETPIETKKEVYFYKNYLDVNRYKGFYTSVFIERKGKLIKIHAYQAGDLIYILRYNLNKKYISIDVYEIILEDNKYKEVEIQNHTIYYINEIYKLNYSEELEEEIRKLFLKNTRY